MILVLGKRTRFLGPVVWQCFPWTQTPLWSCLKLSKYVISQPDWSEYAQKIWSQRRDSIERLLAASGWMKPAGTSCNIPIGQNPPTWRGNNIVLARPWPDDLVQCRSSCAGGGISACCSTPHTATGPRILVRPALVVECRIAARTAMVSRPPPRLAHPLPNLINIFLNEYSGFCFELNFELNHF